MRSTRIAIVARKAVVEAAVLDLSCLDHQGRHVSSANIYRRCLKTQKRIAKRELKSNGRNNVCLRGIDEDSILGSDAVDWYGLVLAALPVDNRPRKARIFALDVRVLVLLAVDEQRFGLDSLGLVALATQYALELSVHVRRGVDHRLRVEDGTRGELENGYADEDNDARVSLEWRCQWHRRRISVSF